MKILALILAFIHSLISPGEFVVVIGTESLCWGWNNSKPALKDLDELRLWRNFYLPKGM